MTTYEQDPDVVRWGLQLFDSDPYSSCGYYGTIMQPDVDYYHGQYFKEDNYDTECGNLENDELIAQALEEQLSQLTIVESPGYPDEELELLQVSSFSQDWVEQSMGNCSSGISMFQELKKKKKLIYIISLVGFVPCCLVGFILFINL